MSITPLTFPDLSSVAGLTGTTDPSALTGANGVSGVNGTDGTDSTSGTDFGNLLLDGIDQLQGLQNNSDNLAVQAATGDESAIHDYTIAATEASTATQLAVTLRNQAIGAFNQIMQMQV